MKSLIFFTLMVTLLFSSCNNSYDPEACLNNVKVMFPDAEIYTKPQGSNHTFVVIDSVNIYLVKTASSFSPKVTDVIVLRKQ